MSGIICHNKGRYNIYNTIYYGFRFASSIGLEQLKELTQDEHGTTGFAGLAGLSGRLDRAHKHGFSAIGCGSFDDFVSHNRAGENETELTTSQCIDRFLS